MPPAKRGTRQTRRSRTADREAPQSLDEVEVTITEEDLDDFNESKNILIYGPSGHGKTVLAGGAPRATYISTEKGVVAAKRAGSKARLLRAPTWEHVIAAKKRCDETRGSDDWVILDSATKMQVLMIRWILRTQHAMNSARDLDIPAIQDHQKWQNYFKRFIDSLIEAPYNTIFITTEMRRDDEEGEPIVIPAITGKDYEICDYVRAQMDVVLYYQVTQNREGERVRRALAQPWPPYIAAKDRYNALGMFQDVSDGDYTAMADFIDMIDNPQD
jgi:AAA domain-containing protein